jgi:hypothetical protein
MDESAVSVASIPSQRRILASISVPLTPAITTGGGTLVRGRCRFLLLTIRANATITVKKGDSFLRRWISSHR